MAPCLEEPSLADLPDGELVERFRAGEIEAVEILLRRYRRLARAKARAYFLVGADRDDIEQEGMIGLFKAARDFQPDRQASFRAFAELCITRQLLTAVKTATRHKHQFLNTYVPLMTPGPGAPAPARPGTCFVSHLLGTGVADPADAVVSAECLAVLRSALVDLLSALEVEVLRRHVAGKSYQEIGEELGRHVKSIDNALQRIKRKLDTHLHEAA